MEVSANSDLAIKEELSSDHHLTLLYSCTFCPYETKWQFALSSHCLFKNDISRCSTEEFTCCESKVQRHKCGSCEYRTFQPANLISHVKTRHSVSKISDCPTIVLEALPATLERELELNGYVRIFCDSSNEIKWNNCNSCSFETRDPTSFEQHDFIHFSQKPIRWFYCEYCSYKVKSQQYLSDHKQVVHVAADYFKWFECGQCEFRAISKNKLQRHICAAHNLKTFKCSQCPYQGKYGKLLRNHQKICHGDV